MDYIYRALKENLSFRTKKRKRDDGMHPSSSASPPIPSVFASRPRKVNESVYEVYSPSDTPTMEVLFFHGLQFGGSTESHSWTTWESGNGSFIWPEKWLVEDFPGAKIMFVSYDGNVRNRNSSSSDLYIIIENLISDLLQDGVGQMPNCPLIMVGHCFGGIVIKQLCLGIQEKIPLMKRETDKVKLKNILDNLKGIFYYDTPHHGISGLNKVTYFKNDPLLPFFQTLSRDTERLNHRFSLLRESHKWHIHGLGASLPTKLSRYQDHLLVPESFGREGDVFNVAEDVEHYSICKPMSRTSRSFYALKYLIDKIARKNEDALERTVAQAILPLPFVPDANYVPIVDCILEIQKALEREEGPRVVNVYGGPGLGKSCVVKYIGLQYAEERMKLSSSVFPDGVYYLFCGRGARDRVKELHLELLRSLGFGVGFAALPSDTTATGIQQGDYVHLPSHQINLRSRLSEKKLLIVLDDVWEVEVLKQLIAPTKGVKYLITSQNREIWGAAEKVQMKAPTISEARRILANFTDGLPTKGEFPESIKVVTDTVIHRLNYHPLSLADVGISVNRKRATDESQWKLILDNIFGLLDENDIQDNPFIFEWQYDLTVGAAMMSMVESLCPKPQQFLFLIALLGGDHEAYLPVPLVRLFNKCLQPAEANALEYYNEEKYLEDRSLIVLHYEGDESRLAAHSLRMHFIRKKKPQELRLIASQILASIDEGVELIRRGDADGTIIAILSAVYFKKPFVNLVANPLKRHVQIINGEVIHRNINSYMSVTRDMVSKVAGLCDDLVYLLNVEDGEPAWKRQAHEYAKKIIIKQACQGKLDDYSMACLLQLPRTTSIACKVLRSFCWSSYYMSSFDEMKTFSSLNCETMKTLRTFIDDNAASTIRQVDIATSNGVCSVLLVILNRENQETILDVAAKWMEILALDSNPTFQICIMDAFTRNWNFLTRGSLVIGKFTGILEVLMELFLTSKDYEVRIHAGQTLKWFCRWKGPSLKIAAIPDALAKLVNLFTSKETPHDTSSIAGDIVGLLTCVPQNRIRLQAIEGCLADLRDVLANMERQWRATCDRSHHKKMEKRASIAAGILAQLALENDLGGTIASLPGVQDGLLFLQVIEMGSFLTTPLHTFGSSICCYGMNSTRALTILYPNNFDPPSLERIREEFMSLKYKTPYATEVYVNIYWTRVEAQWEMRAYKAALSNLELASSLQDQIPHRRNAVKISNPWFDGGFTATASFSDARRSLLSMLEDHAGATLDASAILEEAHSAASTILAREDAEAAEQQHLDYVEYDEEVEYSNLGKQLLDMLNLNRV